MPPVLRQRRPEAGLKSAHAEPIVGPGGPGERRFDRTKIEVDDLRKDRGCCIGEQVLGFQICSGQRALCLGAAKGVELAERDGIRREEGGGAAVLGSHVGDRRALRSGE